MFLAMHVIRSVQSVVAAHSLARTAVMETGALLARNEGLKVAIGQLGDALRPLRQVNPAET